MAVARGEGDGDRYMDMDNGLYDKCSREFNEKTKLGENEREEAGNKWKSLLKDAQSTGIDITMM